ncbi:glycoside hydrolase family 35 protein, partial [Mycena olivaceomarginata]
LATLLLALTQSVKSTTWSLGSVDPNTLPILARREWRGAACPLILQGQRVFLYVYTHMGLINPSRGVVDFDSFRALQAAYINAETTAGGISHWATSEVAGVLRTNATDWRAAWQAYVQGIIEQTAPTRSTTGDPSLVYNEYSQSLITHAEYFQELEDVYHNSTIAVPLTYNDPGEGRNFINGTGAVDLYGLDAYPQGFDCSHPEIGILFFQGGSFDAWGPTAPGYALCAELTAGPNFQSVYSSYDYGASISESRALTTKFDELKLQGYSCAAPPNFIRPTSSEILLLGQTSTSNSAAFATFLQNPDTKTGFYVLRPDELDVDITNQLETEAITTFKLNITTSLGKRSGPPLSSLRSLWAVENPSWFWQDYSFGSSKVFYAGTIGGRDILFLYGNSTQAHEIRLALTGTPNKAHQTQSPLITFTASANQTIVAFQAGVKGLQTVWDSNTQLVLFADSVTVTTFWAPVVPGTSTFGNYWALGSNTTVLVGGPYLVRNATISGSQLALVGDLNTTVPLTVVAPSTVKTVTWNGASVRLTAGVTATGGFTATLTPRTAVKTVAVPKLTGWKSGQTFDDSTWTVANHTTTNIPFKPYYGDGRILYGCDYGFCENIVLWRGHFTSTGAQTSVNLSINGGEAFAASVWLNNAFLGTSFGNSTNNRNILEETDDKFAFPAGAVHPGDNVITIVQDNMGLNETNGNNPDTSKSPRGVRGFKLSSGSFGAWKVQGKVGGYTGFLDKTRGVLNEGGLFGERKGWHLPGFDTSSWASRDLATGLPGGSAGVGFFVTTFSLNIPSGIDASCHSPSRNLSAKTIVSIYSPQAKFPVHQGILNFQGVNTVAVALWSMGRTAVSPNLQLVLDGVLDGGVLGVKTDNPQWSPVGRV